MSVNSFTKTLLIQNDLNRKIKLEKLGISEDIIIDVALNAVTYKTDATKFDTKSWPGYAQWNAMVNGLRNLLCTKGWENYEVKGVEGIKSINKQLVILPMSGNAATGNPNQPAGIKRKRGEAGIHLIDKCCQGNIFTGYTDKSFEEVNEIYILLYYNDSKELRLELSKPSHIVSGMIRAWEERIIFPSQELSASDQIIIEDNIVDEYDILVEARENVI